MNAQLCFSQEGVLYRFRRCIAVPVNYSSHPLHDVDPSNPEFVYVFAKYDSITSFDLQLERTLADRDRIPLLRLSVELSNWPLVIWNQQPAAAASGSARRREGGCCWRG